MINLTKEQQQQYDKISSKISLAKDKDNLDGYVVNLSKCIVDLGKKSNVDLGGKTARVVVAIDYSGSMSELYRDGTIQQTLNRLVPLGLSFDDNGELEVFLFQEDYKEFAPLTLKNYSDYKTAVIDRSGYHMGGTMYSPVLEAILKDTGAVSKKRGGLFSRVFSNHEATPVSAAEDPLTFVLFITDGEPFDNMATDKVIRESAKTNTFIQFIGIGLNRFKYLKHLDDLGGRVIDNTGFSELNDLNAISDEDLYTMILEEFAGWIKAKGL